MNREKQDSAYDMLGFRVVHVLNNCLLRVMPPVEQHGKRRSVRIPRLVCVLRAIGHSSLEMYRQRHRSPWPIRASNFAQTAAVNGRRLLSSEHIE
jgi:hypothetical protein